VTGELCRELEVVAHDFSRHLALEYVLDGSLVPRHLLAGGARSLAPPTAGTSSYFFLTGRPLGDRTYQ
jgi:hypothetical protein